MIKPILNEIKNELNKQYPGYSDLFNPPATEQQLAAYEKLTGFPLPEDLKALYTLHNGQQRTEKYGLAFFFSLPFLTLDESMQQWKLLNEELGDLSMLDCRSHSVPAKHIQERYVNRGWIPLSKDSGGNYIGVDLNPDALGTVGQVINFGRDEEIKYVITCKRSELYSLSEEPAGSHFKRIAADKHRRAEKPSADKNSFPQQQCCKRSRVLRNLPHLQYLSASKLPITDLRPLEALPLTELSLEHTPVTDLEPLSKIRTLWKLDISYTNVSSLAALAGMESLTSLNISGSKINDLSFLDESGGLRELKLYDLSIKDYTPLFRSRHLTNMTCSFDLFKTLKQEWKHKVKFTIRGEMTEEQLQEWRRLR